MQMNPDPRSYAQAAWAERSNDSFFAALRMTVHCHPESFASRGAGASKGLSGQYSPVNMGLNA
jgi:hypothetical protein